VLYVGIDLSRKRLDYHVLDEAGASVALDAVPPDSGGLALARAAAWPPTFATAGGMPNAACRSHYADRVGEPLDEATVEGLSSARRELEAGVPSGGARQFADLPRLDEANHTPARGSAPVFVLNKQTMTRASQPANSRDSCDYARTLRPSQPPRAAAAAR
jgi:hypothetical protein